MLLLNLLDDLKLDIQDAIISHNMNKNIDRYNKAVYDSCEYKVAHMNLTEKIGEFARIVNESFPDADEECNGELIESYGIYFGLLLKSQDMHEFIQKIINAAYNDEESCSVILNMIINSPVKAKYLIEALKSTEVIETFGFSLPAFTTNNTYQNNYSDMVQDINYTREDVFNILIQKAEEKLPECDNEKMRSSIKDLLDQTIEYAISVSNGEITEQFMLDCIVSEPERFFDIDDIKEKMGIDLEECESSNEEEQEDVEATFENSTEKVEVKNETEPIIVESKSTIIEETPMVEPKPVETLKTPDFVADESVKEPEQAQDTSNNETEEQKSHINVDHAETYGMIMDNINKDAADMASKVLEKVMDDVSKTETPKPASSRKTNSRKKR